MDFHGWRLRASRLSLLPFVEAFVFKTRRHTILEVWMLPELGNLEKLRQRRGTQFLSSDFLGFDVSRWERETEKERERERWREIWVDLESFGR